MHVMFVTKILALFLAVPIFAQEIALKIVDMSEKGDVYVQVENTGSYGLYLASPDDIDYSINYFFEAITIEGESKIIQRKRRLVEEPYRTKKIHLIPGEVRVFKFELLDGSWNLSDEVNFLSHFKSLRVNYRQGMDFLWASVNLSPDSLPGPFISFSFIGECSSPWHLKKHRNHCCTSKQKVKNKNGIFFVYGLKMEEDDVQELNRLFGNRLRVRTQNDTLSISKKNKAVYYVSEPDRWMERNVYFKFELDNVQKIVNSEVCNTLSHADNTSVYNILAKYRGLAESIKAKHLKQSSDWIEKQDFSAHSQPPDNKGEVEKMIEQIWDEPLSDEYEERK